jgi:hypothetical protein
MVIEEIRLFRGNSMDSDTFLRNQPWVTDDGVIWTEKIRINKELCTRFRTFLPGYDRGKIFLFMFSQKRGRRDRNRVIVGFTTTSVIQAVPITTKVVKWVQFNFVVCIVHVLSVVIWLAKTVLLSSMERHYMYIELRLASTNDQYSMTYDFPCAVFEITTDKTCTMHTTKLN